MALHYSLIEQKQEFLQFPENFHACKPDVDPPIVNLFIHSQVGLIYAWFIISGEFLVPIQFLVKTQDNLLLREVDNGFVKRITSSYNGSLGAFTSTIFPVQVIGKIDPDQLQMSQYQTLGGNHPRVALEQLNKSNVLEEKHKPLTVKVYRYGTFLRNTVCFNIP